MANIYTCTAATGDIAGLTTEVSGDVKINYTLSNTSAGSAGPHTVDGTYEDVVAFDASIISLVGYTGIVTVNAVNGLGTKTQASQQRLLTHTDAHLGVELDDQIGWYVTNTSGATSTTDGITHSFKNLGVAATDGRIRKDFPELLVLSKMIISFDIQITSGGCMARTNTQDDAFGLGVITTSGSYSAVFDTRTGDNLQFWASDTSATEYIVTNFSLKEISTQNKYYINGIEQTVTPPLPDPDVTINLNDTAVIGYADTIDRRDANFKVYDTVRTAEEILADHNKWISATYTVLTDGNGDPLTDANGVYLYTT